MQKKHATRRDVAEAAGVSLTTVTHALNPPPGTRMDPRTRERVEKAAQELGYLPSFIGRALVSGRSYTVGLLQECHASFFYQFFQEMILGFVLAMEKEDYHPLLLFRTEDQGFLKAIRQGRVDGMLVVQRDLETTHIARILETGLSVVVMNKSVETGASAQLGCVHADHAGMVASVMGEFAERGCRTVLAVIDARSCDANVQIADAFAREAEKHLARGMTVSTLAPSRENFALQVRSLLAAGQRWDGVFVDGAEYASILVDEASACGFEPGRNCHLISAETQDGAFTRQRRELCAYTQQPARIGEAAWELLRSLMDGSAKERKILVPYRRHTPGEPQE